MKNNNHYINRLIHPVGNNEMDLCADISEQPMHVIAYERSLNDHCANCDKTPYQVSFNTPTSQQ